MFVCLQSYFLRVCSRPYIRSYLQSSFLTIVFQFFVIYDWTWWNQNVIVGKVQRICKETSATYSPMFQHCTSPRLRKDKFTINVSAIHDPYFNSSVIPITVFHRYEAAFIQASSYFNTFCIDSEQPCAEPQSATVVSLPYINRRLFTSWYPRLNTEQCQYTSYIPLCSAVTFQCRSIRDGSSQWSAVAVATYFLTSSH
jgi:hypothetical protein